MKKEIRSIDVARWLILLSYVWTLVFNILSWFEIHWLTYTRTVNIENGTVTTYVSILGLCSDLFFMYAMWLLHKEPHPAVRRMSEILLVVWSINFLKVISYYLFPELLSFYWWIFSIVILIAYAKVTAYGCILRAETGRSGKSAIGLLCIAVFVSLLPTLVLGYQPRFLVECTTVGSNILNLYGWNRLLNVAFDLPNKAMTNYRVSWKLSHAEWGFIVTAVTTAICMYLLIISF